MSPAKPFRDPFRLLKAILIGVSLGFIAVMLVPYVTKSPDGRYALAMPKDNATDPLDAIKKSLRPTGAKPALRTAQAPENSSQQPHQQPQTEQQPETDQKPQPNQRGSKPPSEAVQPSAPEPTPVTAPDEKPEPKDEVPQPPTETVTGSPKEEVAQLKPAIDLTYPKPFTTEEMTTALASILSYKISDTDKAAVTDATNGASRGMEASKPLLAKISDVSARKFAEWRILRASNPEFSDTLAFRTANPLFPPPPLDAVVEKALFASSAPSAETFKIFANRRPVTGPGKAVLGAAYIEKGERDRGLSLIRQAWSRHDFDAAGEARFQTKYGSYLTDADRETRKTWLALKGKKADTSKKLALAASAAAGARAAARLASQRSAAMTARQRVQAVSARGAVRGRTGARWVRPAVRGYKGKVTPVSRRLSTRRRGAVLERDVNPTKLLPNPSSRARSSQFGVQTLAVPVLFAAPSEDKAASPQAATNTDGKQTSPPPASKAEDTKPAATAEKPQAESKPAPAVPTPPNPVPEPESASAPKPADKKAAASSKKTNNGSINLLKESQSESGPLLTRLVALKRQKADKRLWSVLRSVKTEAADLADPERWWEFRRQEVRRALNLSKFKTAYGIAKHHGPLDEEARAEAEFLAGWIALQFLKDANTATVHFQSSVEARGSGRDQARSAYWLARGKAALEQPGDVETSLRASAKRAWSYYGALAKNALRDGSACEFRAPPKPTSDDIAAFVKLDAIKSLMILKQLDQQGALIGFFLDLARQIDDPVQMTLMLELAERIASPSTVVRTAKIAIGRGFPVEAYALPALLPKFDAAGDNEKIELPLLNALTRQESEFDAGAKSPVGARGLMQLMPGTARLVASGNKLKYELGRLTSDPSYNVTLGSSFLASLLTQFDGSYIMSLAAYNAGPGRVAQWSREFGDPRRKTVDPIDWVERIPFTETREYVQRIMESTQLYRCRFEKGKAQIQIWQDINRGRPGKLPEPILIGKTG